MKNKLPIIILLILLSISYGDGWIRFYGDSTRLSLVNDIIATPDSEYIIIGTRSIDCATGDTGAFVWTFKIDNDGDIMWEKIFADTFPQNFITTGYSISNSYDGNYYYLACSNVGTSGGFIPSFWIIKMNSDGDTLWSRLYGGDCYDEPNEPNVIVGTYDGGYAVTGYTYSFGAGENDVYFIRGDSSGDTLFTRIIGTPDSDAGKTLVQTSDSGFILCGLIGGSYITKLSPEGDIIWEITPDELETLTLDILTLYDIVKIDDNHFLVAGCIGGHCTAQPVSVAIDSMGNIYWEKIYSFPWDEFVEESIVYSTKQTSDGGLAMAGYVKNVSYFGTKGLLLKTDSHGNMLWYKFYEFDTLTTGRNYVFKSLALTPDGGFIMCGNDVSRRLPVIIKTDSLGEIDWVREIPNRPDDISLSVFPNPFNSVCEITVNVGAIHELSLQSAQIEIYDLRGNLIATPCSADKSASLVPLDKGDRNRASAKVSGGSWTNKQSVSGASRGFIWRPDESISSGVYFIEATTKYGLSATKKILYLK